MLGNATEKIARVVDLAEELYERVIELRDQVTELRETARETRDRVAALEAEIERQRRLLEAVAEAEGIDVEALDPGPADEAADAADVPDAPDAPDADGEPAPTDPGARPGEGG